MASGIYSITNTVDGKVYIGSAVNVQQRWWDHRKTLRAKHHRNAYLQAAWNRDGESAFVFSTLLECAPEALIDHEQVEIKRRDWNQIYNLNPTAGSQLGRRHSAETKQKISAAQLGKPGHRRGYRWSAETRAKMLLAKPFTSDATRAKMAAAKAGRKRKAFTAETLRRMSVAQKNNSFALSRLQPGNCRGKPWSPARRLAYELREAV